MPRRWLLFLIIFIEGYAVLAVELLSIRQLIPYVGSDTVVISIVISAVLLPLAFGYYCGGQFRARAPSLAFPQTVRARLQRNLLVALMWLTFGLAMVVMNDFFTLLSSMKVTHKVVQTALYALMFLSYPVFLLGQTVPLISNYFSHAQLSAITGRMLCFSTAGSFLGSVFSTLVLMSFAGVHNTVLFTLGLLAGALFLLDRRCRGSRHSLLGLGFFALAFYLNSPAMMERLGVMADNAYNTVSVKNLPAEDAKILFTNHSLSSKYAPDPNRRFPYVQYIEKQFINTLPKDRQAEILILGAGGFTIGWDDRVHHYTFVDVDKDLKGIAENHFLPSPLPDNKQFVAETARLFINQASVRYDLVVVDFYNNTHSVPPEVTTVNFWQAARKLLAPNGILVANIIEHPAFGDRFTVRFHNSFGAAMPVFTRQVIGSFNPWKGTPSDANVLYIYYNRPGTDDRTVYSDDQNTYFIDR